jgi:transcriptional regulator with XRE-family HTH domain
MSRRTQGPRVENANPSKKPVKKENRILQLRTKLQLSQRALAKKVGVSQQHIQRLETSDDIDVGFVLATKLSEALGVPLDVVFPRTKRVLSKLPTTQDGRRRSIDSLFYDRAIREEMENAGIDMDVIPWFIQMKLRGQTETVDVLLADGEYSRLWKVLQDETLGESFVLFEGADGYRYALQPKHLLAWHFKFDPPGAAYVDSKGSPTSDDNEPDIPDETIRVWFSDGTPVMELDGEMDAPDDFHDTGPLEYIFSMLEMSTQEDCYSFVDSAGEPFWFRSADVALFAAPEHLIASENVDEGEDEELGESNSGRRKRTTDDVTFPRLQ